MGSKKVPQDGTCKLTGKFGRFVRAHLIPEALTRPREPNLPFEQGGEGHPPIRRWTSWYDPALVIREGEDILERHDTWAVAELRKKQLVWSGWGTAHRITAEHEEIDGTDFGLRELTGIDPVRLRLFILSLLWRAAATNLPEFNEIGLPTADLERLRLMLLNDDPRPLSFYPANLIQLSTRGETHNHTPIAWTKSLQGNDEASARLVPIFRFYFDGLIVHVERTSGNDAGNNLSLFTVGHGPKLLIQTIRYEVSFQQKNLKRLKNASAAEFRNFRKKSTFDTNER